MGRRCCCGSLSCLIFSDDFNRGDSTDLGADWLEDVGDSEISGNTLLVPHDGRVICLTPNPALSATAWAYVKLVDLQDGDVCRVIVDFIDDEDDPSYRNYLFAEFEADGEDEGVIRVGSAVAGVASHLDEMPSPYVAGDILYVCRSYSGIYAHLGYSAIAQACVARDSVQKLYKSGVENLSGRNVKFDNFYFEEHHHTNPDCNPCFCDCENFCVPKALTATIEATGDVSCMDGTTITLDWDNDQLGDWVWHGTGIVPHWQCPEGLDPTVWDVWLRCASPNDGSGPEDWVIGIRSGGPVVHDPYDTGWNPASWTCDPFVMTFPWTEESWSCEPPCVGHYRLVVTG